MVFENWIRVLTEPKQVFAEEKANASLGKAIKIIFVAGIIAGIFNIIASYILFALFSLSSSSFYYHPNYGDFFGTHLSLSVYLALLFIATILLTPIMLLVGVLIESGIFYIFAKLLKGKGNFTTQTYLYALLSAPCIVITAALNIIPFIGGILGLLILIYELYLLTLALKETHQYSTGSAVLTWLIPGIIVGVIVVVIFIILFISSFSISQGHVPYYSD